ncbi:NAD-dependent epimerase/dehydratase family protein [Glycomyces dulcitolivorans]|uniref:NAD-dependent epimerase/dehydratase family protein n=1 Tax=Glycomyces dulcitolivorans TaxID=2200759 RepID=UPI000DD371A9|nr:NAD-dependent epimerase/dehydratase family protein [Glycomyces dulcitolivorans]
MTASPTHPIRRAVVTGASGFIGSHLTRALLENSTDVIAIDQRDPAPIFADLVGADCSARLITVGADLRTCAIEPVLLDADVVFHLAGMPGVRPSWGPDFAHYVDCNIHVAQRIMTAAIGLQLPRVVVASSSSVYGATGGTPSLESDPTQPASPYGVTKLAEEQLCLAHARRSGVWTSVVALRYFTVFGPGQREDMFIQRALRAANEGTALRIYGDGTQRRDFTFVGDAVQATMRAGTAEATAAVVNVGRGSTTSLNEVIGLCEAAAGASILRETTPSRDGDVPATYADITVARDLLGWEPTVSLAEGIAFQHAELTATPVLA